MKGGLKKKNVNKLLFQPIYDMIIHPDTKFSVFIVSSLKGFMVSMHVTQDASEYLNRNSGGNFTIPVTNFLFKIAIVTTHNESLSPFTIDGKTYPKSSEPKEDFYQEAILQQKLWTNSIEGGKIEVCPSVVGLGFLQNPTHFFSLIKRKLNESPAKFNTIEKYLFGELNNASREIGIIVQSLIEDSSQIEHFIQQNSDRQKKHEALIYAGAQLIRLFISYKVIHFDCHLGNILVVEKDEDIKCFIIDFGLVCVFRDDFQKNDDLDPRIHNRWIAFSNKMFPNQDPRYPKDRENIIKEIFAYMLYLDLLHLRKFFSYSYTRGQMSDLYNLIQSNDLFEQIYNKYVEIASSDINTSTPHKTFIRNYEKKGFFEFIDQPINTYSINDYFLSEPSDYCCRQKDCIRGALAGTACCIGSCAVGLSTGTAMTLGATTALMGATLSQKMDRGGGGKKSKTKKSKKSKTKKHNKFKKLKKIKNKY